MRTFTVGIAILGILATRTARADSRADVEKLVRAHVAATAGKQGAFIATLTDQHTTLIDASGGYLMLFADCEGDPKSSSCDSKVPLFDQTWFGTLAYSNIKPIIHVDDANHVATFFVTADLAGDLMTAGAKVKGNTQMRIIGVARLEKSGWKVIGAKYAASLPDSALFTHGQTFGGNKFDPKPGIEAEVASWFGHLADHQSTTALGVSGTAPDEVATTAAAMAKLAKSWDKLDIKPYSFGEEELGNVAFVEMTVTLKTKKKAVDLSMAVVAVKEGAAWKWAAIDFGAIMLTDDELR